MLISPNQFTHEEWLEWRRNGIGGSDAASAIGEPTAFSTPHELWKQKVYGEVTPENFAMRRGSEREPEIRNWVEKTLGDAFFPMLAESEEHPWIRASLDGINLQQTIAIEIKNINQKDHLASKKDEVPMKYFIQCQHIMLAVPSIEKVLYVSCPANGEISDSVIVEILRDEDFIQNELFPKLKEFMEFVTQKEAPPFCERDFFSLEGDDLYKDYIDNYRIMKELTLKDKEFKERIKQRTGGLSAVGYGVKLIRQTVDGTVDYKKMAEDYAIPIENYRKKSYEKWVPYGM